MSEVCLRDNKTMNSCHIMLIVAYCSFIIFELWIFVFIELCIEFMY